MKFNIKMLTSTSDLAEDYLNNSTKSIKNERNEYVDYLHKELNSF